MRLRCFGRARQDGATFHSFREEEIAKLLSKNKARMQLDHDFLHWQFFFYTCFLGYREKGLFPSYCPYIPKKISFSPKTPFLSCDVFAFNHFITRSSHRLACVADGFLGCFTFFIRKVKRNSLPFSLAPSLTVFSCGFVSYFAATNKKLTKKPPSALAKGRAES